MTTISAYVGGIDETSYTVAHLPFLCIETGCILVAGRTGFVAKSASREGSSSDWYAARLDAKQKGDEDRLKNAVAGFTISSMLPQRRSGAPPGLVARRAQVQAERVRVGGADYRAGLVGTLGVQPLGGK